MNEACCCRLRQVEDAALHEDLRAGVVGETPDGALRLLVYHAFDRERGGSPRADG